jgi:hypothetical protein
MLFEKRHPKKAKKAAPKKVAEAKVTASKKKI